MAPAEPVSAKSLRKRANGSTMKLPPKVVSVPPGSHLAMSNATLDFDPSGSPGADQYNARVATQLTPRGRAEIARFFEGLDLVEPGLVPLPQWRALASPGQQISLYAAVGSKA